MTENLKKALELISVNAEAKEKVEACIDEKASVDEINAAIVEVLKSYGAELTEKDLVADELEKEEVSELSEDELISVAGGRAKNNGINITESDCKCVIGGGGVADKYQHTCACVVVGSGEWTKEGYAKNPEYLTALRCGGIGCSQRL